MCMLVFENGCLDGRVVCARVSYGEDWEFESGWRCPSHPTVEIGACSFWDCGNGHLAPPGTVEGKETWHSENHIKMPADEGKYRC